MLPRPLRLWEVVSVVQDLDRKKQLEIVNKLCDWSNFVHSLQFSTLFLASDLELFAKVVERRYTFYTRQIDKFSNITRLSLIYALLLDDVATSIKVKRNNFTLITQIPEELLEYLHILNFESLVSFQSVLIDNSLIASVVNEEVTTRVINSDLTVLESYYALIDTNTSYSSIFRLALVDDRKDIIDYLTQTVDDKRYIREYILLTLSLAKEEHLQQLIQRYLFLDGGDELEARTDIIEDIGRDIHNVEDGKERIRARMLLSIACSKEGCVDFESLQDIIDTSTLSFFSAFVVASHDKYNWMTTTELYGEQVVRVYDIFDRQV